MHIDPEEKNMENLVNIFKALSDKTRLRIIFSLLAAGEKLCICEIMDALKIAQYNISRHIKELKNAGLVQEYKEGKFVFYALTKPGDKAHAFLIKILEEFDKNILNEDKKRLEKRLALRVGGKCVVGARWRCC